MVYTTHPWRPLVTKVDLKIELQLVILTSGTRYSHQCGKRYSHQWYKIFSPVWYKIFSPVVQGNVDRLLGESVVRKAWVGCESIWTFWGFTIQCLVKQGHVCFSTYVVEDGLCNSVKK